MMPGNSWLGGFVFFCFAASLMSLADDRVKHWNTEGWNRRAAAWNREDAMRKISDSGDHVVVEDQVSGITAAGFWLGHGAPKGFSDADVFIPKSLVQDADTDLDEIELGDEITIEIPRWLAVEKGLVE